MEQHLNVKQDIDQFLRTRDRSILGDIVTKLYLPSKEAESIGVKYNSPLISALLLHVAMHLPQGQSAAAQNGLTPNNASLDVFVFLAHELDCEGRYLVISAIANHLRYPNAYTHYFSCVLLY